MEKNTEAIYKSLLAAGYNQGIVALVDDENKPCGVAMNKDAACFYFMTLTLGRLIESGAVKLVLNDGIYPQTVSELFETIEGLTPYIDAAYEEYREDMENIRLFSYIPTFGDEEYPDEEMEEIHDYDYYEDQDR